MLIQNLLKSNLYVNFFGGNQAVLLPIHLFWIKKELRSCANKENVKSFTKRKGTVIEMVLILFENKHKEHETLNRIKEKFPVNYVSFNSS